MPDLSEGAVFAGHRIEGVAGRGGMGTVYRATHIALDHLVALKVISPDLAGDDSFRERFRSESRIAVSLRHPNVVPIHHAGEEDGLLFVTMDLIDGPDLRRLLLDRGPQEPEQAVTILEQVGSALDVAHSRGLVHRDIKPGNILIEDRTGSDHAYLTDFGLTKRLDQASEASALTSTGAFVGTLDYVAPEQIRGEELDARTDVYALGCVLYEMLAGAAPYASREEKVAKMYAHLQDRPEPLAGRAGGLDAVVARAMAKDREGRFPSAGDLARSASAALRGRQPAEAERSVATGPAAPTQAYEAPVTPGGVTGTEAPPPEPTLVSESPPDPTVEARDPYPEEQATRPEPTEQAPPADSASAERRTAAGRVPAPTRRQASPAAPGATQPARRSRLPLVALVLSAAAAAIAVVVIGGGDDGSPAAGGPSAGSSGGESSNQRPAPRARVADGGLPGGELPVGVAVSGGSVFTADRAGFRVLRGDAESLESNGELSTDAQPEDLIVEAGSVWITVPKADQVIRSSTDLVVEQPIQLPPGSQPSGIASGAGSIWVTNQGSGTVSQIDPETGQTGTVELGAQRPHGIAVAQGALWVSDRDADVLIRHDLDTGENTSVSVGDKPKGVAVAEGVVWVANTDSGTVSAIDAGELEPVEEAIEVGGEPRAVDVFGGRIWVSNGDAGSKDLEAKRGWVSIFDADERTLLERRLVVGGSPEGLGVGAGRVWVATGPEQLVRAIDPG